MQRQSKRSWIVPLLLTVLSVLFIVLIEVHRFDALLYKVDAIFVDHSISEIMSTDQKNQYVDGRINAWKEYVKIGNYLLLLLPIAIISIVNGTKVQKINAILEQLGNNNRELLSKSLLHFTSSEDAINSLNIRFYLRKKRYLKLVDINGFYNEKVKNELKFDINKNEGIVSECFNIGHVIYEQDNCFDCKYNINDYQRSAIKEPKFVLGIPIKNHKNQVINVISIDSFDIIKVDPNKAEKLNDFCCNFGLDLYNVIRKVIKGG